MATLTTAGALAALSGEPVDDTSTHEQWQERALCPQTDPDAFFPEKGGSTKEAKAICARCEVRKECLDYALDHDERHGIWGGLSERERRRLKRGIVAEPVPVSIVAITHCDVTDRRLAG